MLYTRTCVVLISYSLRVSRSTALLFSHMQTVVFSY